MINRIFFDLFKNIQNYFTFIFPVKFLPGLAGILLPAAQQIRICKDLPDFPGNMFRLMILDESADIMHWLRFVPVRSAGWTERVPLHAGIQKFIWQAVFVIGNGGLINGDSKFCFAGKMRQNGKGHFLYQGYFFG